MGPYRVVVNDGSGWSGNGMVFDTKDEAVVYAMNLFARWTAVKDWRVIDEEGNTVACC